jgi:hypothetical protein
MKILILSDLHLELYNIESKQIECDVITENKLPNPLKQPPQFPQYPPQFHQYPRIFNEETY